MTADERPLLFLLAVSQTVSCLQKVLIPAVIIAKSKKKCYNFLTPLEKEVKSLQKVFIRFAESVVAGIVANALWHLLVVG